MNIYNQNVAFNYRGILNLDATTINTPLDATLRAVTDGMGTSSPLQLSTDQVGISRTVALSAGATNPRLFNEVYTINNSGAQTGTLTGIFLNATETALNGITHNLMDLQVGGVSKFKVDNFGQIFLPVNGGLKISTARLLLNNGSIFIGDVDNSTASNVTCRSLGIDSLIMSGALLKLGGTTSSFPAIKRNGASLEARLADDSNYSVFNCGGFGINTAATLGNVNWNLSGGVVIETPTTFNFKSGISGLSVLFANAVSESVVIGATSINASAKFQIDSTTKGFLPPRGTNAQMLAIVSPAAGLIFYDSTNNKMNYYNGTAWTAFLP